jgi:hypothetical protein
LAQSQTATPVQTLGLTGNEVSTFDTLSAQQLDALVGVLDATPTVPVANLPKSGTFRSLKEPSYPPLPGDLTGANAWELLDGTYLLDDAATTSDATTAASTTATQMSAMAASGPPSPPSGTGTNTANVVTNIGAVMFNTNLLWLQATNFSGGIIYGALNQATDQVYAICSTTNLLKPFSLSQVETEVFPANTNTFTVAAEGRPTLFLRAQDWTGVTHNGNATPDWWFWEYFGTTNLSDTNRDLQGNTLGSDYASGTDPDIITFTEIETANTYVNSSLVSVQLDITGDPFYIGVLVDDTNLADVVWNPYCSSNIVINLGTTAGWHAVWIGLRNHAASPNSAVWMSTRFNVDFTPPAVFVTSPTNNLVSVPLIQLTGYSPGALASVTYDLSNATENLSSQPAMITGQTFNWGSMEITTNYFQVYDLPLAAGTNAITLQATDLAGNQTTVTENIIYAASGSPPVVSLAWPQNGMLVSPGTYTIEGQVNDPTATATAVVVGPSGNSTWFTGLTGRDGNFWIQSVQFPSGTNSVSLTLSDSQGITTTNFSVIQSNAPFTINPVAAGDNTVSGTSGLAGYAVWVNGVEAVQGNGVWTAAIAPIGVGGGVVNAMAIPSSNSPAAQGVGAQATVQPPQGVFPSSYNVSYQYDDVEQIMGGLALVDDSVSFGDGSGGSYTHNYLYYSDRDELFSTTWPAFSWPSPFPDGPAVDISGLVSGDNWFPLVFGQTNHCSGGPPPVLTEHCDYTRSMWSADGTQFYGTENRSSDTRVKLATGGPLGSTARNLWVLNVNAEDYFTHVPVPYSDISVGGFGSPDTNGNVYVVLPDNDPDDVTPAVKGPQNFSYGVSANEISLVHQTEQLAFTDPNPARLNLGVGELVDLSGEPTNTIWSVSAGGLSGTIGSGVTFTAPSNAPTSGTGVTVTAGIPGKGNVSATFKVFPPSNHGIVFVIASNSLGTAVLGASMKVQVYCGPTDVSFYRVYTWEVPSPCPPTSITGYFANHPGIQIPSAATGGGYLNNNFYDDIASVFRSYDIPFSQGGFNYAQTNLWTIPGSSVTNVLGPFNSPGNLLDTAGDFSVSKYGVTVRRTLNDKYY